MNKTSQTLCAWCGFLCPIVMFTGLWPLANFFPPPSPGDSAEVIVNLYTEHLTGIRAGMIFFMVSAALYGAFSAAIAAQMRRMECRETPVLTYTQLAAGIASIWLFLLPGLIFSVAAFRPERSPDVTQALNDIGWFTFVMPFTLGFMQNLALGFAILGDKRPEPVMPRWVGYFNLWIALLFIPACLLTFFKSGPFAWDGLLAFWIPAGVFGGWFFLIALMVLRGIRQQAAEYQAS